MIGNFLTMKAYEVEKKKRRKKAKIKTKKRGKMDQEPNSKEITDSDESSSSGDSTGTLVQNTATTRNLKHFNEMTTTSNEMYTMNSQANNKKPTKYSEKDNGPFVVFAKQEKIKELSLARSLKKAGIINVHNIYRVNESMLKIIFTDKINANKAIEVQKILECECFVPEMYTNTYGVIKNIDIEIDLEEIKENIRAEVPIISLERIKSFNHSTKTLNDTPFVKIGFRASYLPRRVILYDGLIKEVTFYLPKPMFCTQCISYGHMKKKCHSKIKRCAVCGDSLEENLNHQCKGQNCRFCLNDHITNSKNCEERKVQIKVRNFMTRRKVTYREAKKLVAEKFNIVPIDTTSTIQFPNLSLNTARLNNISKVNEVITKANSQIQHLKATLDQIKQKMSNITSSVSPNHSGNCSNDLILIEIAQLLSEDIELDHGSVPHPN